MDSLFTQHLAWLPPRLPLRAPAAPSTLTPASVHAGLSPCRQPPQGQQVWPLGPRASTHLSDRHKPGRGGSWGPAALARKGQQGSLMPFPPQARPTHLCMGSRSWKLSRSLWDPHGCLIRPHTLVCMPSTPQGPLGQDHPVLSCSVPVSLGSGPNQTLKSGQLGPQCQEPQASPGGGDRSQHLARPCSRLGLGHHRAELAPAAVVLVEAGAGCAQPRWRHRQGPLPRGLQATVIL